MKMPPPISRQHPRTCPPNTEVVVDEEAVVPSDRLRPDQPATTRTVKTTATVIMSKSLVRAHQLLLLDRRLDQPELAPPGSVWPSHFPPKMILTPTLMSINGFSLRLPRRRSDGHRMTRKSKLDLTYTTSSQAPDCSRDAEWASIHKNRKRRIQASHLHYLQAHTNPYNGFRQS
jgi:hypothetical protein